MLTKGLFPIKKNLKIREKLGSRWVGQAPARILFLGKFCVFFVFFVLFFVVVHVSPKKSIEGWVGVFWLCLRDREVACSTSDLQDSIFESCVWRTVPSHSSHHPQEVLLAQFSLYVHKSGLKPDLFHLIRVFLGFLDFF